MDLAMKVGAPVIGLNDSGGARIQEGVASLAGICRYLSAQHPGLRRHSSDLRHHGALRRRGRVFARHHGFHIMVQNSSYMFVTGPDVIKTVMHEDVSKEELGGPMTHNATSGVAHFMARDDADCLALIRELLSFMPQNNQEDPPRLETSDPADRRDAELLDTLVPVEPDKPYDIKEIITRVVDDGYFVEVHEHFAKNLVVGFARLAGHSVGIVANQPAVLAGCLDINASVKGARFMRFCDAFNIPLITFEDVPGFLPGTQQEYGGIIRHGAKLLFAYRGSHGAENHRHHSQGLRRRLLRDGDRSTFAPTSTWPIPPPRSP